jgi:hypothetical protein
LDKESINASFADGKKRMKRDVYNKIMKDDKFLNKIYRNLDYIRISSPYMSDEDKRIEEAKQNREKWVGKRDFLRFQKFEPNLISNYMSLCKYIPPLKEFRDVNKEKWVGKKNFYVV